MVLPDRYNERKDAPFAPRSYTLSAAGMIDVLTIPLKDPVAPVLAAVPAGPGIPIGPVGPAGPPFEFSNDI